MLLAAAYANASLNGPSPEARTEFARLGLQAIKKDPSYQDTEIFPNLLRKVSRGLLHQGKWEAGLAAALQAIEVYEHITVPKYAHGFTSVEYSQAYKDAAEACWTLGRLDAAEDYARQAIRLGNPFRDPDQYGFVPFTRRMLLAKILRDQGQYHDLLDFVDQEFSGEMSNDHAFHHFMADLYRNQGNIELAIEHQRKSFEIGKRYLSQIGISQRQLDLHQLIGNWDDCDIDWPELKTEVERLGDPKRESQYRNLRARYLLHKPAIEPVELTEIGSLLEEEFNVNLNVNSRMANRKLPCR